MFITIILVLCNKPFHSFIHSLPLPDFKCIDSCRSYALDWIRRKVRQAQMMFVRKYSVTKQWDKYQWNRLKTTSAPRSMRRTCNLMALVKQWLSQANPLMISAPRFIRTETGISVALV